MYMFFEKVLFFENFYIGFRFLFYFIYDIFIYDFIYFVRRDIKIIVLDYYYYIFLFLMKKV